jgi:hypothetical protein
MGCGCLFVNGAPEDDQLPSLANLPRFVGWTALTGLRDWLMFKEARWGRAEIRRKARSRLDRSVERRTPKLLNALARIRAKSEV